MSMKTESVAFGGGCFWCTEAVFLSLKGVVGVTPGYAGGHTQNPTYEEVSGGRTGHAEVIKIEYDPEQISFSKLLGVFFDAHDPTQVARQGADVGTQYRSIILFSSDEQKQEAERVIAELGGSGKYPKPVATELKKLEKFYPAEEYHKEYYLKHPDEAYSAAVISPKIEKIRSEHPELMK